MQRVLKVTQDGVSGEVTIEQDEYIIPYKCPKLVISAPQGENPVDYDAVISESWITQDKKNSTANEVVLNIENNETVFPRTATVEMLDKVITIFQYGKPDTSIGDDHSTSILAFPGAEGGGRFTTGGRGGEIYRVIHAGRIITKTKPLLRAVYATELRNPTNHAPSFLMYPVSSN